MEVEYRGIHDVAKLPGYHDEPLRGDRYGQRSIRLNKGYRLIYRIIEDRVFIELLEVHKHDY
ncbi:type II toxin-antitoxin system mRNA interferase toxin, RelE/StbE family [Bdellovibrio bacteriovorus]|uniref:type II toxin-antitoxin system mRNA interferase toxin, RelE/StbE family n=2 Tax=Bdellovibrio TaxID=958 RepID=UPI0035A8CE61